VPLEGPAELPAALLCQLRVKTFGRARASSQVCAAALRLALLALRWVASDMVCLCG